MSIYNHIFIGGRSYIFKIKNTIAMLITQSTDFKVFARQLLKITHILTV